MSIDRQRRWLHLQVKRPPMGVLVIAAMSMHAAAAQTPMFESRQLTPAREYTFGIEGPAVDARARCSW
jgi:signal peptidase